MLRTLFFLLFFYCINYTATSQDAPDFSFLNKDGEEALLSDYQGEVLYLSFWASWCKPCISNFEKYAPMREELESIGIKLLNVNIDKTAELWTKALGKHNINGTHVRGKDLDALQELYQLYSIPAYEIINKKGQFVYLSDAADRNIIDEFNSWLKE